MLSTMNWKVLLLTLCIFWGCSTPQKPKKTSDPIEKPELQDQQRMARIEARDQSEAFDAIIQSMTQRFKSLNSEETDRRKGFALSNWQRVDELDRLSRRRVRVVLRWDRATKTGLIEVNVERQFSTVKTRYGELDEKNAVWEGANLISDPNLERELLTEIRGRVSGEVEGPK